MNRTQNINLQLYFPNQDRKFSQDTWAVGLLAVIGIYLFVISLLSPGLYGDADSITHYHMARYAFKYPRLLVDHWGKPLFTILCAPFAQLGFQGAILFNILCGLITAWLIYRIARLFNIKYALLAIPLTLFAPVYMVTIFTSLTEVMFSMVLIVSIYCFLREKFILSAILISFIPFARTEGLMFLPYFMLAFLVVRQWKAIPFLVTGFILFSIAGYFRYHDLLWFFNVMPYGQKGSALYGSGSFWFYISRMQQYLGIPMLIMAATGLIRQFLDLIRIKTKVFTTKLVGEYYLLTGSFLLYILAQSFLWWQGMMAVLPTDRFMACIMPIGAFLALTGLDYLLSFSRLRPVINSIIVAIIIAFVAYMPYHFYEIPARLSFGSEVMKQTAAGFSKLDYHNKKFKYFDPKFGFYLPQDPFNSQQIYFNIPAKEASDLGMADSTYLIWEPHFGEWEHQLNLEFLLNNPNFKLIDGFYPTHDFQFHSGRNYFSLIFQKVPGKKAEDYFIRLDSLQFDNVLNEETLSRLSMTFAHSGKYSHRLDEKWRYSGSVSRNLNALSRTEKVIARGRAKVYIPAGAQADKLMLVLDIRDKEGNSNRYLAIKASFFKAKEDEWTDMSILTPASTINPGDGIIKLYAWYTGKDSVFVDDLILEVLPLNPVPGKN